MAALLCNLLKFKASVMPKSHITFIHMKSWENSPQIGLFSKIPKDAMTLTNMIDCGGKLEEIFLCANLLNSHESRPL
jgi:hypothetical protein